jgi:choline dehydrogenase-like flavoprotein
MFIYARELNNGQHIESDVCIIGAGAAGITIAREYIGTSANVVLLESGGLEFDKKTQSLYDGKNIGIPSFGLNVNRLRYFGGTTNHWAGHCRPLDPIDFEQRSWVAHSGWPISRADLAPSYRRAQPVVGLGPYEYDDLGFWLRGRDTSALDFDENRLKTVVYNQSPPTRFGKEYRQELKDARNITVYLNANVLEIECNETATQVAGLKVACIDGPNFSVSAKIYILATGGMENARILLLSNQVATAGLGNDNGLVGRFFMDHLLLRPGADISFSDPRINLPLYETIQNVAGGRMFAVIASPEKLLRKEKLNNFRIHLIKSKPKASDADGRIFSDIDGVPGAEDHSLDELPSRKNNRDFIALHLVLEPIPNPDSRIVLSDSTDYFGQRKINVDWQVHNRDLDNAYRAMELAAMEFGRLGLGRAYGEIFKDHSLWPGNMEAGKHHCGTTRMTDNPKTGVVDKNCKLNNVSNLYIAGSSLFPTIGYANPTLTIVALALRLADHTRSLVKG